MTSAEPPTRTQFLAAYRAELEQAGYRAATSKPILRHAERSIDAGGGWSPGLSYYAQRAWTAIGGAGRVSLEKLRGLPE
jgi:hypothetical protein